MPSVCKFEGGCKKSASFGYTKVGQKRLRCADHKVEGMINCRDETRLCLDSNCTTRACFNYLGQTKLLYCDKHKKEGMKNITKKKCEKCDKVSPTYGKGEDRIPLYCSNCVKNHDIEGVICVTGNCKGENCNKYAIYGYQVGKVIYCKDHIKEDMFDVKNPKCEECTKEKINKQATFGYNSATHCVKHKSDDMIDLKHGSVLCEDCTKRATYGIKEKCPTHCAKHKTEDMTDVVSRMCFGCGKIQPNFGFLKEDGTKDNLYCKKCKENDMKNIKCSKCLGENCDKQPTYNYKRENKPVYCACCKLDGMQDVINPRCGGCELFLVRKKCNLCSYCNPNARKKTREEDVVKFLSEIGYDFDHDKIVNLSYARYRPAIKIDAGSHFIIVEVDEDQHSQYDEECEVARMYNIARSIKENLPCVFLRYNPDVFRVNGLTKRVGKEKRLEILEKTIDFHFDSENNAPTEDISVYRLFYNNNTGDYTEKYDIESKYEGLINRLQSESDDKE